MSAMEKDDHQRNDGWLDAALIVVGHGAEGRAEAAGPLIAQVADVRRRGLFGDVQGDLLKGSRGLEDIIRRSAGGRVFVVPFLMIDGHVARTTLPRALGLDAPLTPPWTGIVDGRRLTYCRPVGTHPRLARMVAARAEAACRTAGLTALETSLVLACHGTSNGAVGDDSEGSQAMRIADLGLFADVQPAYLEQSPSLDQVLAGLTRSAVVVDLLAGGGRHVGEDIPDALARHAGGLIVHAGAIGDDPAFADIIIDSVRAANDPAVTSRAPRSAA